MAQRGFSFLDWLGATGAILTIGGGIYWWFTDGRKRMGGCTSDDVRARVVAAAKSQVGQKNLNVYFADAAPQYVGGHAEWCGIFALWAMHQAGLLKSVQWKTGLGFLETVVGRFPKVGVPQSGDVAYFTKLSHHAVVESVNGDHVNLINGNGEGGVVSLSSPELAKATAYYSIQKVVDEYVAKGCPS